MPRKSYKARFPIPKGLQVRYIITRTDIKFIKKNWRALNETPIKKAGLLIHQIMRGSIRRQPEISEKTGKRLKPSKPGKPPYARSGLGGKPPFKYIISDPEYAPGKGVIGHVRFHGQRLQSPPTTPMQTHEFGERVQIKTLKKSRKKAKSAKQRKAARKRFLEGKTKKKRPVFVTKTVNMPPRPFAFPALNKAKSRIGQFWKNIIHSGNIKR